MYGGILSVTQIKLIITKEKNNKKLKKKEQLQNNKQTQISSERLYICFRWWIA